MVHDEGNRSYLVSLAVAQRLLQLGIIDEADFSALETSFATKFLPLFRYEKPCLLPSLPITQTGKEGYK